MIPAVSSMALSHLLGQDDQKDIQHYIFGHMIPLAPVIMSCQTHHYGTMHNLSQDNQNEAQHWYWCWHHMKPMASQMAVLHSSGQDNWNEKQYE